MYNQLRRSLTSLNSPPFPKMPRHHLFRLLPISRLLNPTNIKCPILPIETTHTSHIISVIRKLFSRKTVLGGIRHRIRRVRKSMSVFALPTVWTTPTSEKNTYIFHPRGIGTCKSGVAFDAASSLRFGFTVCLCCKKMTASKC